MSRAQLNRVADLLTYTAMTATIFELVRPRKRDSEILRLKIETRIRELKAEELRLVATRAYIIELWGYEDA